MSDTPAPDPQEGQDQEGAEQTFTQEQIDAAAAAARRETEAKAQAKIELMQQELEQARKQGAVQPKPQPEDHPVPEFDFDSLSDPAKAQHVLDERAKRIAAEQVAAEVKKLREEREKEKEAAAEEAKVQAIKGQFAVFSDDDYGQEAEDKLAGILFRHDGEYTEEVFREACAEAAKHAEKLKAADVNKTAEQKKQSGDDAPPPPAGGSAEAMGVPTNEFSGKMTAEERRAKIQGMVRKIGEANG